MTALLPALSLSNKLLDVGALAAFAALLGIAVLSLLVFAQAREIRRLREWAGRAPERAAELEQRVSTEAAMRAGRVVHPPARAGVVANPTPVVARAVAAQPAATAVTASGQPAPPIPGQPAPAVPGQPAPGQPAPALAPGQTGPAVPGQPTPTVKPTATPVPGQPAFVPTAQIVAGDGKSVVGAAAEAPGGATASPIPATGPEIPVRPATAAGAAQAAKDPSPVGELAAKDTRQPVAGQSAAEDAHELAPVPADDAPSEPAGVEAVPSKIAPATVAAVATAAASSAVATRTVESPPRAPAPPPARPVAAAGEAVGGPSAQGPSRPPLPPRPQMPPRSQASQRPLSTASARPQGVTSFQFLQEEERSPRKATALIVGGAAVGVAVLLAVLLSLGGGSSPRAGTGTAARSTSAHGARHAHGGSAVVSPAETHVVVLNATEATGLAHRLSGNLQQSGYTQAAALSARPPSERPTSVVEYASGHRPEAQNVGQTLSIGELAPMESAIASLVGGATVVVIAGADKASLVGSGNPSPPSQSSSEGAASGAGASSGGGEAQSGGAAQNGSEAPAGGEAAAGTGQ